MPPHRPLATALLAVVAALGTASSAVAVTTLFSENFDGIPLGTSPTYQLPGVWSSDPPSGPLQGWDRRDSLPGFNDPSLGVLEFKGWNFWDERSWKEVAGGPRRRFSRAEGTVAVADPDTWNDLNNPASLGTYNTFLETPQISLDGIGSQDTRLVLGFDTSWRGGCCSNGQSVPNNQTAIIRARINGGPFEEVFRWESARFRDAQGRPTNDPIDPAGNQNESREEYFVPRDFDDREFIELDIPGLFDTSNNAMFSSGPLSPASSTSGGGIQFEFAMEDAGDDGWWAVDNIELASYGGLLGDMNHNGALDVGDYDAFALAMLDTLSYQYAYSGASPSENGSLDSEFDLDDIPYFLTLMKGVAPPPAMSAFWSGYAPIPEPSAGLLATLATLSATRARRGGLRGRP